MIHFSLYADPHKVNFARAAHVIFLMDKRAAHNFPDPHATTRRPHRLYPTLRPLRLCGDITFLAGNRNLQAYENFQSNPFVGKTFYLVFAQLPHCLVALLPSWYSPNATRNRWSRPLVLRQKIFGAIVLLTNIAFWVFPSDVVRLVAEEDHVLLGYYSREHFAANLALLVVSIIGLYIDQARTRATYKRRWFQVLAVIFFALPVLFVVDWWLRKPQPTAYIQDRSTYHRQPNAEFTTIFLDQPPARRSYPGPAKGYPPLTCKLRTDGRGFRNSTTPDHADVVVLGDSFAEGANVSDEQVWPLLFGQATGLSVCNLAMCGYSPDHYIAAFNQYGAALRPKFVVCMLYEGNDLRPPRKRSIHSPATAPGSRSWMRSSPIRATLDRFLIDTFGPIGAEWNVSALDPLSWLPLQIPSGPDANFYAFRPVRLVNAYKDPDLFQQSAEWLRLQSFLDELHQATQRAEAQLIIAFAPAKAHVMLPLVADQLPAEKFRTFLSIRSKELPPADELIRELPASLDFLESAIGRWCQSEAVPFFSPTTQLRSAAAQARQVYFTYDNHWTPEGHEEVARGLADWWPN
jgi:hypothetical protein